MRRVYRVRNPPEMQETQADMSLIPGLGGYPGGGHVNPLQYSHLENHVGRGARWDIYSPWGCNELDKTQVT